MRYTCYAVALLFAASTLFAEERRTEISVFASDLGYTVSDAAGSNFSGGVGLALNQWWTSRISTQLSVTAEKHFSFRNTGAGLQRTTVREYPVDLVAQYHFPNQTRWQPYVGLGARAGDRIAGEINAGVLFQISPQLALTFDARRMQRETSEFHDSLMKFSIGLGWRF